MMMGELSEEATIEIHDPGRQHGHELRFGRHVASPAARALLLDGVPVCIGARAFDLLIVLLESQGRVVGKNEIMQQVWPTTTVDDSNLRFQMTSLRKALSCDRDLIKTIPGRGYLLAAEVQPAPNAVPSRRRSEAGAELAEDHSLLRSALCSFLSALRREPDAVARLETLLSV